MKLSAFEDFIASCYRVPDVGAVTILSGAPTWHVCRDMLAKRHHSHVCREKPRSARIPYFGRMSEYAHAVV